MNYHPEQKIIEKYVKDYFSENKSVPVLSRTGKKYIQIGKMDENYSIIEHYSNEDVVLPEHNVSVLKDGNTYHMNVSGNINGEEFRTCIHLFEK